MPQVVAATVGFLKAVGVFVAGAGIGGTTALIIGTATVVAGAVVAKKLIDNIYGIPSLDGDRSRQATVRGTVEPQKLIYGEALVSGPISFVGVSGNDNRDLYHVIVLAGHQSEAITDIHFDDLVIPNSSIDIAGVVTSGTFGPQDGTNICLIRKKLGTQTTADPILENAFASINTNEHIGTNLTYIITKFTLTDESQEVWDKFLPQDIKALVKGKKIYDPRQDSTSTYYDADLVGGVSTQRSNDPATWEWSDNPVWCLVDYLTDDYFGMNISLSRIDLAKAVAAADICDTLVDIPNNEEEKRFTCNGVLFGTVSHKANINKLLSSMNGMLTYTNGKFLIRAGAFEAVGSSLALNDDHLTGPAKLKTSFERNERFNTITGTFIDPSNNYKEIEFPRVQITSALTRDNNEELREELKLNMTNSFYMAQRIAHKLIQQSDLQKVLTFPTNLAGVNIAVGDRVSVTLSEFNYTNKTFVCLGWSLSESGSGGVNLILREDDSASYVDMAVGSYSTVTPSGGIQQGFFGVPKPIALSATALVEGIELDWTNPVNMTHINSIEVFASPNSSWSSAVKIGETIGTQFLHDASNGVDPIADGDERYYWVRARRFPTGEGTDAISDRNPDSDTSTVNATRGALGALASQDTVGDGQIDDNAVGPDQIADGAIEIAAFAAGINPVQVVSTLPVSASEGDVAFLTTDNNLYRYDGTAWTKNLNLSEISDSGALAALNTVGSSQIDNDAITNAKIAVDAITSDVIAAGAITTTTISDDAITTAKINAGAVTASEIATGTITATQIAAGTITGNKIAADTITGNKIAAGSIDTDELAVGAVTAATIAANTITASEIAANTLTAGTIAAGAIGTTELAADAVRAENILVTSLDDISADAGDITAGSIGGITISSTELYQGLGTFKNANTGFYLDSNGDFSLKDKLSFDNSTSELIVDGTIRAEVLDVVGGIVAGNFTANSIADGSVFADSLTEDAIAEVEGRLFTVTPSFNFSNGASFVPSNGLNSLEAPTTGTYTHVAGKDVRFEFLFNAAWDSWEVNYTFGTNDENATVKFEHKKSGLSTWTTVHTATITATKTDTPDGHVFTVNERVTYTLTGLAAGAYEFRVTIQSQTTGVNYWSLAEPEPQTYYFNLYEVDTRGLSLTSTLTASSGLIANGLTYPTADGTNGQVITTDGSGNLSFTSAAGGGLSNVVDDTTPQLGGDLDLNSNDITGTGNIDVTGLITSNVIELSGGVTFDPSGGGAGTDTATDVGIALSSGTRIVGTFSGYIRSLLEWNSSSDITIGQSGTNLISGINLLPGNSGDAKVNGNRILTVADEGSGNGLDADTLDGFHSASTIGDWFGHIPHIESTGEMEIGKFIDWHFTDTSTSDYSARSEITSTGVLRHTTAYGYIDLGPNNSSYAHFSTDRSQFYFSKKIIVDEGIIKSYNEDLQLGAGHSGTTSITIDYANNEVTLNEHLNIASGHRINHNSDASRDKIRVWSSSAYTIGMDNGMLYGHVGDYAMTFQMNDDPEHNRGWVFLDQGHSDSQGAMSLTTNGRMTVATSLSVGEGESVTSPDSSTLNVSGNVRIGNINATNATHQGLIKVEAESVSLNTAGGLEFVTSTYGSGYGWKISSVDSTGVHLDFGTRQNSTTWSHIVRFMYDGRVAIGDTTTDSNANQLKVKGTRNDSRMVMSTASTTASATIEAQVANYWTGPNYTGTSIVQHDSASSGTTAGISNANLGALRFQNGSAALIYTNGGTPIHFATASTERMQIRADGIIGIGTNIPQIYGKVAIKGGKGGDANSNLTLITDGAGQSELANLSLYGTFENTPADNAPRRTADIVAGFEGGNWGTEYLAFHVGRGGTANDGRLLTTERVRIDGSGKVGIGASTINRKLEISANNNGSKNNYIRITDEDTTATLNNPTGGIEFFSSDVGNGAGINASIEVVYAGSGGGGEFTFNTASNSAAGVTEKLRIDENGKVGIGTSLASSFNAAGNNLVVGGGSGNTGMTIYSGASSFGSIHFADGTISNQSFRGYINYEHTLDTMDFGVAGTLAMVINSSGNVYLADGYFGVNNSGSFNGRIHAKGDAYTRIVADGTSGGVFSFYGSGSEHAQIFSDGAGDIIVRTGSLLSDRMIIKSDGKIGINRGDPLYKFHVLGDSLGTSSTNTVNVAAFQFPSGNADFLEFKGIRKSSGSDWQTAAQRIQRKVDLTLMGFIEFGSNADNLIVFGEGNTEYMRVDGSGNVGISNTNPIAKLHVGGTVRFDHSESYGFRTVATDTVADQSFYANYLDLNISGADTLTADRSHVGLYIDVDSSATGGDISNEHRVYGIYSDTRATNDSDQVYAGNFYARSDLLSGTTSLLRGITATGMAHNSAGQVTSVYGSVNIAYDFTSGTGACTQIMGAYNLGIAYSSSPNGAGTIFGAYNISQLTSSQSQTVSKIYGSYNECQIDNNNNTYNVNDAYAVRSVIDYNDSDNSVTVQTGFLFHGEYQGTLPTNAYGVYIPSGVRNYFAGDVGIGNIPIAKLDILLDTSDRLLFRYFNGSQSISAVNNANSAYRPIGIDSSHIYFRSTNGLYMQTTQFLTSSRALINIASLTTTGTVSCQDVSATGAVIASGLVDGFLLRVQNDTVIDSNKQLQVGSSTADHNIQGNCFLGDTLDVRINSSSSTGIMETEATNMILRNSGGGRISFYMGSGGFGSSTAERMYLNQSGNLFIDGTYNTYSDERLKDNIKPIENALKKVEALNGVTFKSKESGRASTGLIAQDVEKVLPEAVAEANDGYLTVQYGNTIGLLVEAIKELKQEIDDLKSKLEDENVNH